MDLSGSDIRYMLEYPIASVSFAHSQTKGSNRATFCPWPGTEQISEEPDQFPIITAVSLSFHRPENRNPFDYSSQRHPLRKNRELPSQEA
jgi:hypothetical protein